jgi:hypothetical protein
VARPEGLDGRPIKAIILVRADGVSRVISPQEVRKVVFVDELVIGHGRGVFGKGTFARVSL